MNSLGIGFRQKRVASVPPACKILLLTVAAGNLLGLGGTPSRLNAQPTPPEEAAREFFEALGRLQWEEMAARLHTQVLDEFHLITRQLVDSRVGDSVLVQLYDASRAEWESWSARYAFRRTMEGLVRYARGLMESQVATDFSVLGTVPEGDSIRHVVYREATDHMGTTTGGVATISLTLEDGRWQVRANAELEVLKASLRGIPIGRQL